MFCRPTNRHGIGARRTSHRSNRSRVARQRGAALIVALLVFAVASALIVGLQRDFTLQLSRGRTALISEQSWSYLLGAEALAAVALQADLAQDARADTPRDHLSELWASEATPYPLEDGGWLRGQLSDLQGRFNVNSLVEAARGSETEGDGSADGAGSGAGRVNELGSVTGTDQLTPPQKQFVRLLQSLESAPVDLNTAIALTMAVVDYLDSDAEPRPGGAEDERYRTQVPPYRTANRSIASVSELRAVAGITPDIYRALAPLVSVWPERDARLNILTAPLAVLRSINDSNRLEPLDRASAEQLMRQRDEGAFDSVETFIADPAFTGAELSELAPYLDVRSDWFLLDATVAIAEREQRLYSVMQRDGGRVLSRYRSQGEL